MSSYKKMHSQSTDWAAVRAFSYSGTSLTTGWWQLQHPAAEKINPEYHFVGMGGTGAMSLINKINPKKTTPNKGVFVWFVFLGVSPLVQSCMEKMEIVDKQFDQKNPHAIVAGFNRYFPNITTHTVLLQYKRQRHNELPLPAGIILRDGREPIGPLRHFQRCFVQ